MTLSTKGWAAGLAGAALLAWPVMASAHGLGAGHHGHRPAHSTGSGQDAPTPLSTLTGKLLAGGRTGVEFTVQGTMYAVRFGPPWFTAHSALGAALGSSATLTGHLHGQSLQAVSLNGHRLRGRGKPPWAGAHGQHHG